MNHVRSQWNHTICCRVLINVQWFTKRRFPRTSHAFLVQMSNCTTKANNKRVTIFICLVARIHVEITNKCGSHRKGSDSFHWSAHLLCVIYVSHASRFEVKKEYTSKCCYAFHHRRFLYILAVRPKCTTITHNLRMNAVFLPPMFFWFVQFSVANVNIW